MHHQANRAGQDTEEIHHGDGNDHDRQQLGIGGNIGSGRAVPPTVPVTETDTGALIVQGRPNRPRVYLTPGEAATLRGELAIVFGSAERALRDGQEEAR
jgi:hypothetical protein